MGRSNSQSPVSTPPRSQSKSPIGTKRSPLSSPRSQDRSKTTKASARSGSILPSGSNKLLRTAASTLDGSKKPLNKPPAPSNNNEPFFIEIYEANKNGEHTKKEIIHRPPRPSPTPPRATSPCSPRKKLPIPAPR